MNSSIRIFGNVSVDRDDEITGQAVAVFGSVRVDGKVADQVVAVFGSVVLGSDAVVGGDVVSVGGRVIRNPGAQTRGGVTEVALTDSGFPFHVGRWGRDWEGAPFFFSFGAVPRLIGTTVSGLYGSLCQRPTSGSRLVQGPQLGSMNNSSSAWPAAV